MRPIRPHDDRPFAALAAPLALPALVLVALFALAPPPAAAQPAAAVVYTVVFEATWSVQTHPEDFPANAHFSWLVGGTHDATVSFWDAGADASLGIQRMAERGDTTPLDLEVAAVADAGHAGEVILGGYIPSAPGTATATFTATTQFPLATVVAMIAPSPDWFVGVSGLSLLQGGQWVDTLIVELWPFDAGTDSGTTYGAANQPTSPHVPIAAITGSPFAPGVPLGTFSFELQTSATAVDGPPGAPPALSLDAAPNPFNPRTRFVFDLPAASIVRLTIHGLDGRCVRTLHTGTLPPGAHALAWDGRDDAGRTASSGVYVGRLEAGAKTATRWVVLLK